MLKADETAAFAICSIAWNNVYLDDLGEFDTVNKLHAKYFGGIISSASATKDFEGRPSAWDGHL